MNTKIEVEIPQDIRALLAEKSRKYGMDESSYAAQVIIDYLRSINESQRGTGSKSG